MSINISNLEDNERLNKDSKSLEIWLKDVELLTYINQFTDEDLFIQHYIKTHKNLSIEDLKIRLEEVENLLHITKNFN